MFDQELAGKMAGMSDRSIASVIYRSMLRTIEGQYSSKDSEEIKIKDLLPSKQYMKISEAAPLKHSAVPKVAGGDGGERRPPKFNSLINSAARKYRLNPELIRAVIKAESNFDPDAVSHAGAKGLMQLIDSTAEEMGVANVFDPRMNIEGGSRYLRQMIDRFGDIEKALAAYNAGPTNVEKYNGIPPYIETVNYVEKVLTLAGTEQLYY
jgi:hypothetical protein